MSPLPFRLFSAPSLYNVLPSCSLDLRAVLTFGTNFTAIGERFCLPLILPWLSDFSANQLGVRRLSEFIPHKLGPRAPCAAVCMLVPRADSFFFSSQGQMVGSVGESSNRCEELCSGCGEGGRGKGFPSWETSYDLFAHPRV